MKQLMVALIIISGSTCAFANSFKCGDVFYGALFQLSKNGQPEYALSLEGYATWKLPCNILANSQGRMCEITYPLPEDNSVTVTKRAELVFEGPSIRAVVETINNPNKYSNNTKAIFDNCRSGD